MFAARPTDTNASAVISVSQLNRSVRDHLERRFPLMWIAGEISNFRRYDSGHCYFTLKDADAQVRCVMFRTRAQHLDWEPQDGMQVDVRALVSIYEPRGDFQLNIEAMRRSGLGPLYERFVRLKAELEAEGVFDAAVKRPIPAFAQRVGVITSLAAAALRDILSTLARRNPSIEVILYPVPVQGEGAAQRIAQAIATASARAECDVLILARGGGSIEDLWSFNEAVVARAIRASHIPVVSGIGHETDFTIADFAADLRAPTPTAAAESVSASRHALLSRIAELTQRITRQTLRRLDTEVQRIDHFQRRLIHPRAQLESHAQLLRQLTARLRAALPNTVTYAREQTRWVHRLRQAIAQHLAQRQHQLARLEASLVSLDPTAVLNRGYSITRTANGKVVRDANQLTESSELHTHFAQGWARSRVTQRGD